MVSISKWGLEKVTNSVKEPAHAPVAVPGFKKNLPSYSVAWNLVNGHIQY